jgi:hypothetical protein
MAETNQHWEVIANGVNCVIETAMDLWQQSLLYFQWCDANKVMKPQMINSGEHAGEVKYTPYPRPYTDVGLCLHLGLTREWLYDVANQKENNDFKAVAQKILQIIYTQKLEYAIVGIFNPVISSKILGLKDGGNNNNQSPIVQINVEPGPKLLEDERDVDLPEIQILDSQKLDSENTV